jgi:undecaprenyl-phosphate 4-deoxy-4-formamido-L-arabinose transferase
VVAGDELRRVEPVVGLAEELERPRAVFRQRRPAERHLQIVVCEAVTEQPAKLGGLVDSAVDENRELVAADAGQLVVGAEGARQRLRDAAQLEVPGGVPVRVVDELEVVHVAEQEQERFPRLTPPGERLVEHAGVEDPGEEVAVGELAQLLDVAAMLAREPSDQHAAGAVGEESHYCRGRHDVACRQPRRDDDCECVEPGRGGTGSEADSSPAGEGEQGNRDVEEVPEPEPGALEHDEAHEHRRVEGDRGDDEQTSLKGCRGHQERFVVSRLRSRPSKEGSERAYAVVMSGTETVEQAHVAEVTLPAPDLSIVVTIYNEAGSIEELYRRTTAALDSGPHTFELIFVDDGSTDGTFAALERLHKEDPRIRAVRFKRNFGQHPAMHAGLSRARGHVVVTMDGDLQNEPEDIPRLVEAIEAGYDVASGRRVARKDPLGRALPSRVINGMLRRFTRVDISDFGCAFNAYRRSSVEPMLGSIGKQKFTKALVVSGGASVVEVDVGHAPRQGPSRYSPLRLTRLALHVLAGFWPQPIQWIGVILGTVSSLLAFALGIYGVVYWIDNTNFPGPLFGGVAVLFVLGIQGFILALIGEYLGRIQRDVEGRPLYTIDREL